MTATTIHDLVAANIRRLREERDWSQGQLAARIRARGLTRWTANFVTKVESGTVRADRILDLAILCEVFGISLTDLLTGDGPIAIDDHAERPMIDIRMALVGLAPPTDDLAMITEEYNLDRFASPLGLDQGEMRMVVYALYGRQSFLDLRDERAGVQVQPGTRANIAARRGYATKVLLAEISKAIEEQGVSELIAHGIDRLRNAAVDTPEEEGTK